MDYLPIFLDVGDKLVIVDGGTTVAARRIERALNAGARVHVFDPAPEGEVSALLGHARLTHFERLPTEADFAGCVVAYGASENPARDELLHKAAKAAGATFGVSPGATDALMDAAEAAGLPMLPGAATASEAMRLLERGYDVLKFFPAEASGGVPALKGIGGPLPQITFCPTGGVNPKNAPDYLALSNVICAGGSWVAPADLVASGKWDEIEALAAEAARLGR